MRDDVLNPSAPAGKSRKYALPERERRFLLTELPPGERIVRTAVLTDRYLLGTRLRIRSSVETAEGSTITIYKLTQKVPASDGGPGLITTLYLDEAEYAALSMIPARLLRKTRYSIPPLGIDVFEPPLDGLVMAEVEFSSEEELRAFLPPSFAVAEVTQDARFTGGRLAETSREGLLRALADFGVRPGAQRRSRG